MKPYAKAITALVSVSLVALLSGCAEQADRDAAAVFAGNDSSCPEHASWTMPVDVVNMTGRNITLGAQNFTCDDWSGTSTPGRVFNEQVVKGYQSRTFSLEPRNNRIRNWTMTLSSAGADLGSFSAVIPMSVAAKVYVKGEVVRYPDGWVCTKAQLGLDPIRTPSADYMSEQFLGKSQDDALRKLVLWSDGTHLFAISCEIPST